MIQPPKEPGTISAEPLVEELTEKSETAYAGWLAGKFDFLFVCVFSPVTEYLRGFGFAPTKSTATPMSFLNTDDKEAGAVACDYLLENGMPFWTERSR